MSKKQRPRMMFIEWHDAAGSPGWRAERDIQTVPAKCQSVGFLIRKTKKAITLACSRNLSNDGTPYDDSIVIPRSAIRRKRRLK